MELEDRRDNLRLLALMARGNGATDLDEYEPPSQKMPAALAERPEQDDKDSTQVLRGVAREVEVRSFMMKVGDGE